VSPSLILCRGDGYDDDDSEDDDDDDEYDENCGYDDE